MVLHLQTFQIVTQDTLNVVHALFRAWKRNPTNTTAATTTTKRAGTEWKLRHRHKPGEVVSRYLSEFSGTLPLPIYCK